MPSPMIFGIPRQQRFRDVHRALVDVEFHDGSVPRSGPRLASK